PLAPPPLHPSPPRRSSDLSLVSGRLGSRALTWRVAGGSLLLAIGMAWVRFTMSGVGAAVDPWQFVAPLFVSGMGLGIGISGLFQDRKSTRLNSSHVKISYA